MTESPKPPEPGDRLVAAPLEPPHRHRPARPAQVSPARSAWGTTVTFLVWAVRVATRLAALVLVLYAVFTVFKANPANVWYQFVESLAGWLSLGLANLFQLADVRWTTLVDYGLAAIVWLIIGSVVASLIRRASP
ncbi:hypothetical protein [Nonomuraea sediminis]|uniref:hypothetical protein n=1 Tax=Nonomuraea sediminis TaxID=2835864 RepID=UPI001BDC1C6D|nr:hypothetical protein [Nonomuraea sediminis]